jgi:hypothetical protein
VAAHSSRVFFIFLVQFNPIQSNSLQLSPIQSNFGGTLQALSAGLARDGNARSLRQKAVIYSKINPELSGIIMEINDLRRLAGSSLTTASFRSLTTWTLATNHYSSPYFKEQPRERHAFGHYHA